MENCNQSYIPETDNTLECCEQIILDKCIKITQNLTKIRAFKGSTLAETLKKIDESLDISTSSLINLTPRIEPSNPSGGMIYADVFTGKLRYYNGVTNEWNTLNT